MLAIYPGSFDPPTVGHLSIIDRALTLFDEVVVLVSENRRKPGWLSFGDRSMLMKKAVEGRQRVKVVLWRKLITDYCRDYRKYVLVRGVRTTEDFSHEVELFRVYRQLLPTIEVIYLPADPRYRDCRSSLIRELHYFGASLSEMVPPVVEHFLTQLTPSDNHS